MSAAFNRLKEEIYESQASSLSSFKKEWAVDEEKSELRWARKIDDFIANLNSLHVVEPATVIAYDTIMENDSGYIITHIHSLCIYISVV